MEEDRRQDDDTRSFVALTSGTEVGHYTIISKIGAGGMGEVYLAEDTELHRKVALKFLPMHLCQDEDCRKRFKREAQAAAKLDHPHIVPVYEVGEFKGRPFFAMAHIEGRSLREVIREGKLTVEQAIAYSKQICEGLHKAHESGVVHRDIKPGNVIIDTEDRARIVDFGLATVSGEEKLTKTGSTLGTVGYMSPEQIEGKKVDHRSDIFSVGVMLYEMLTGRRPFEGDTDAAVGRAITDATPEPIARYKSGTTGELQQIINKALQKDPSLRYQHADGVLADLCSLASDSARSGPVSLRQAAILRPWLKVLIMTAGTVLIIAAILYLILPTSHDADPVFASRKQITFEGNVVASELSPDGRFIAYVLRQSQPILNDSSGEAIHSSPMQLFVQEIGVGQPLLVFEANYIGGKRKWWSPDATEILMCASKEGIRGLYLVPRTGGQPRVYTSPFLKNVTYAICWAPDGKRFAAVRTDQPTELQIIEKESGNSSTISMNAKYVCCINYPDWSPDGELFLYNFTTEEGNGVAVQLCDGGEPIVLLNHHLSSPHWNSDGSGIRCLNRRGDVFDLVEYPLDRKTNTLGETPRLIAAGLESEESGESVSVSSDDKRVAYIRSVKWSNLYLIDRDKVIDPLQPESKALTTGTSSIRHPQFSPDGREIAFAMRKGNARHIYVLNMNSGVTTQITHVGNRNNAPVWSPSGERIAYRVKSAEQSKVALVNTSGGNRRVFEDTYMHVWGLRPIYWSPSGLLIYEDVAEHVFMVLDTVTGSPTPIGPGYQYGFVFNAAYSPAGNKLAFLWSIWQDTVTAKGDSITSGIWVMSLNDSSLTRIYSHKSIPLGWSEDGEYLYFWRRGQKPVMRLSMSTTEVDTILILPDDGVGYLAMSNDTRSFVYTKGDGTDDVWLVEKEEP